MPVLFDNLRSSVQTATVSLSVALTAASNAVLLALFCGKNANSVSAVAYGGVSLTRLGRAGGAADMTIEIWGLTAPAAGTNTLSANFTDVGTRRQMVGVTYINARGSSPFGTMISATANLTAVAMSISATINAMVVGAFACSTYVSASNATARLNSQADMGFYVGDTAGAAVVSLSAVQITDTTGTWALAGIPIYFSAAAAAAVPSMGLMNAGF